MGINQEELRERAKLRLMSQKEFAKAVSLSKEYFNGWFKGHKDASEKAAKRIENFLDE